MVRIQDVTLFKAWLSDKLGYEKADLVDYICACLKNDGITRNTLQTKLEELLEDETQLHQLVVDVFATLESGSYMPSPAPRAVSQPSPAPEPTATPAPIRSSSVASQSSSMRPERISPEAQTGFQSTESATQPAPVHSSYPQPRAGDRHHIRADRDSRSRQRSREPQDTRGYRRDSYDSRDRRGDYRDSRDSFDRRGGSRRDIDSRRDVDSRRDMDRRGGRKDGGADRSRRSTSLDEDDRDFRRQRRGSDDEGEAKDREPKSRIDQQLGESQGSTMPQSRGPKGQAHQPHHQQRFNPNHNQRGRGGWGHRGNMHMQHPPRMPYPTPGPMMPQPWGMGPPPPMYNNMQGPPPFMRPPMHGGGAPPPHNGGSPHLHPAQLKPNTCLELTDVPAHLNARAAIIKHFSQFGTVIGINESMNHQGRMKPDCAILEMATLEEAEKAFKSEEAVLGNRFVKIHYTSRQPDPIPGVKRPSPAEPGSDDGAAPNEPQPETGETGDVPPTVPAQPTQKVISRKAAMALEKQAQVNKLVEKENQRQQLLKASLAQQKQLIAQFEDANRSAEDKAAIKAKIQEGMKLIELLKKKGKLTAVKPSPAKRPASTANPSTATDPAAKRDPSNPNPRGRGAGRGRGRGRGRGGGGSRRATTTVLVVKGFAADEADLLTPHFASIGHLVSVVPRGDSALVTFRDRRSGHEAINKAQTFGDKTLSIDWYDPFARKGVAPVVALSRHDVTDEAENDVVTGIAADAETTKPEAEVKAEQETNAVPQEGTKQETETSQ
eukprot:m.268515 g.268515  ORF g.268515 m.268515 type:complete len:776 (+) comp17653_c0_seq1:4145-6472(+)